MPSLTFAQFIAKRRVVPSLAEALPEIAYYVTGPGIVYPGRAYIEGPATVYDNPVAKTGEHPDYYLLCLGNQEYVSDFANIETLERELYDWCVSEGVL